MSPVTLKHGFSMPSNAPWVPAPPVRFVGNRVVGIGFRTHPAALAALVPAPLVPNAEGRVSFYVGRLNLTTPPCPYLEAGLRVPVTLGDKPGLYFVYLYLDKAMPIAAGREIYGFPKKDAEISLVEEQDHIRVSIARGGATLVQAALDLAGPLPLPQGPQSARAYNLKLIPSVVRDAPPDVLQITSCFTVNTVQELRGAVARLALTSGPEDPLGDIPVLEVQQATFSVADLTLEAGEVAYNYLATAP
jgi:acetoacetate decarboxylase